MICKEYDELTSVAKLVNIGKLVHAYQSDSTIFKIGNDLIEMGELRGLFDGVTINPEPTDNDKE